jgi:hypothetical protein
MHCERAGGPHCQGAPVGAYFHDAFEVQREVALRVGAQACGREREKPPGRGESPGMGGVPGKEAVLLEVYEGSGKLNQALIKAPVGVVALQPQVFQNIMGLVIFSAVETREKSSVLRRQMRAWVGVPVPKPSLHTFVFFHSL